MADPDGGQTSTTNAYLPGENFGNSGGDVDQMEMDDPPFSPSSSFSSSSSSSSDLIPKPIGEAGRRNSGGYNLEEVLRDHSWDRKRFLKLRVGSSCNGSFASVDYPHQKYTVRRIEKYLDTRVSFKFQDKDALKQVIDAVCRFPIEVMQGSLIDFSPW